MPRSQVFPDVPWLDSPEYTPRPSACQMSTAAPWSGRHVSATVIRSRSGTPDRPPRMSERTRSSAT